MRKKSIRACLGESIPAFIDNEETDDKSGSVLCPTKPPVPTVGHQYVACIFDDLKHINYLIEIDPSEMNELIREANARRNSLI